jgi:hypothetical protein
MTARDRSLVLGALLCVTCAAGSPALAAGPPLPSTATGTAGAVAPGGHERLIAEPAGEDTRLVAVRRSDRRILRTSRIGGRWTIAPATFAGGTTGLSADGRTLVVVRPIRDLPPPDTRLAVIDAEELVVLRRIVLPGFFTVDAISPDGRWLYLIQYERNNVLDYRVRAMDTRTGRLAARDIVDPREPDEQMGGLPMTRAMSRDGRWVYTLYAGGEESFIHALDTVGRTAACVDLDMLSPERDLAAVRLHVSRDGRRIAVRDADALVATVDTRTFAVREPGEPAEREPEPDDADRSSAVAPGADGDDDGGGFPWLVVILVAGLGGLTAVATLTRRVIRPG